MPSGSHFRRTLGRWLRGRPEWYGRLDPATLLVFVHIPKAAGTSLNDLFETVYGRGFLNVSNHRIAWESRRTDPAGVLCLAGHFPYGWHRRLGMAGRGKGAPDGLFEGRRILHVSVVRDPVERFQSYYRYVQARPKHRHHRAASGMTPRQFVDYLDAEGDDEVWTRPHRLRGGSPGDRFFLAAPLPRLGEFVSVLGEALEWPVRPGLPHSNRTEAEAYEAFDAELLERVEQRSRLDRELYDEVSRRFEAGDFPAFAAIAAKGDAKK